MTKKFVLNSFIHCSLIHYFVAISINLYDCLMTSFCLQKLERFAIFPKGHQLEEFCSIEMPFSIQVTIFCYFIQFTWNASVNCILSNSQLDICFHISSYNSLETTWRPQWILTLMDNMRTKWDIKGTFKKGSFWFANANHLQK